MQSAPSCWPGKGLEKMVFFPYFSNPHGRPSRIPWGRTPWKGQDVPQELCQSRVLARSWGRPGCPVPSSPKPRLCVRPAGPGAPQCSGAGRVPTALGARDGEHPCWRERPRRAGCAGTAPAPPAARPGAAPPGAIAHCQEKLGPRAR